MRIKRAIHSAGLLLVCLLLPASLPMHAGMFLKLPGIPGESIDRRHAGEIDVLSWSWGASNAGAAPVWRNLLIVKGPDKSTPRLMESVCKALPLDNAVLSFSSHDRRLGDFYRVELSDVVVSSLALNGNNDPPAETVTLSFTKLKVEYVIYNGDGMAIHQSRMEWDLASNTGGDDTWEPALRATLTFESGAPSGTLVWNTKPGKTYRVLTAPHPAGPFKVQSTHSSGDNTTLSVNVPFNLERLFFRIEEY